MKTTKICSYCERGSSEIRYKIGNTRYRSDIFFERFTQEEIFGGKFLIWNYAKNLSFKTNSLFTQTPQVCFRLWRFRFVKFVFRLLLSRQSRQLECICCGQSNSHFSLILDKFLMKPLPESICGPYEYVWYKVQSYNSWERTLI